MLRPLDLKSMMQSQPYDSPDAGTLQEILLSGEDTPKAPMLEPESLGNPAPFPERVPVPPDEEDLERIPDQTQLDTLAQIHLEEMKNFAQASEKAQWKASNPLTR